MQRTGNRELRMVLIIAAVAIVGGGCPKSGTPAGEPGTPPGPEPAKPMDEGEISLRKDSVFEVAAALPAPEYPTADPGENKKLPRAFHDAPPMVPHVLDGKLGKSLGDNECLECHENGDDGAPRLPPSHLIDAVMTQYQRANAKDGQLYAVSGWQKAERLSGWRFDCKLCHVRQATNLEPLVPNGFQGATPTDGSKDALDSLDKIKY